MARPGSPLQALRQERHALWLAQLKRSVAAALAGEPVDAASPSEVLLFGSRARGDWDGFSDTDLLVLAPDQGQAERLADRLQQAGVGDDVLPLPRHRWEQLEASASPYWQAIRRQAVSVWRATE